MSKTHRETKNTAPPLSESEAELRQMLLRKRQELLARIQQERGGLQAVEMAETSLGAWPAGRS